MAGNYAEPASAKAAQTELEEHLGGTSLWIRPYSAIQEEAVAQQPAAGPGATEQDAPDRETSPSTASGDQDSIEDDASDPAVPASAEK